MPCDWLKNEQVRIVYEILDKLKRMHLPTNAAIVFDIDDTLIDRFGNPIIPVINLYNIIKQKGIYPVIITARSNQAKNIEFTQAQLRKHNIFGEALTYFRPPEKTNFWHYKHNARKNVHERGLTVIMSIGDELWDIGEYGGIGFRIPKCVCE